MSQRSAFHRRLGFRLSLGVALLTGAVLGATGWVLVRNEQQTRTRELILQVLTGTRSLAVASSAHLLSDDPELRLHPMIQKALQDSHHLDDISVLDADGHIQGHRDLQRVGQKLQLQPASELIPNAAGSDAQAWIDADHIVITQPVHHLDRTVGTLVARARRDGIRDAVTSSVRQLATVAGSGMILVIALVVTLVRGMLRPLNEFQHAFQRIGSGDLTTRVDVKSGDELGMLAELVNSMASGLHDAQEELLEKHRLDHELEIARELQEVLLPGTPRPPRHYDLATHYSPALEVSGDYYDIIPLPNGKLGIVIADVSGKGIPGLLVMAMFRVTIRGLSTGVRSPAQVFYTANLTMGEVMSKEMFITGIFGVLDPIEHTFTYVNAGHCPPMLITPHGARQEPTGGNAIGMLPEAVFVSNLRESTIELGPGESLLLYTDGLVEAWDDQMVQLGEDAVLARLSASSHEDPATRIQTLTDMVSRHRGPGTPTDDLTMVVLERLPVNRPATVGGAA